MLRGELNTLYMDRPNGLNNMIDGFTAVDIRTAGHGPDGESAQG
jgi:hypothetical protein